MRFSLRHALTLGLGLALTATAAGAGGHPMLQHVNDVLTISGADYRVEMAEYITIGGEHGAGTTIFANDRGNKQLAFDFVPFDARRAWSGPDGAITWINDLVDGATASGLTAAETAAAIGTAMGTWDGQTCSDLPLNALGDVAMDLGVVQNILSFGGSGFVLADLTHAGWLPRAFFDAIAPPNGGDFILGVTFTFQFVGADGNPTDIDNNGAFDAAFREINYNDAFSWAIGGNIDVETVALHEAGHGLSQAHFGKIFRTDANGMIHFAPRAVMNAAYSGVQQSLTGTDVAGHCSNWGSWPNN